MGFSTDQYPSDGEMAHQQAIKALSATIRTEKLLAELVAEQNQKVSISELRRILPVALELTDEQHDKLRRLYPILTNKPKPSEDAVSNMGEQIKRRRDKALYGYMGLGMDKDLDKDLEDIFKAVRSINDK